MKLSLHSKPIASSAVHAFLTLFVVAAGLIAPPSFGQAAKISEEVRSLETYPFSEPNAVPILTKDTRLYPYFSFEGYSLTSEPQDWNVVKLENEYIEVYVLPEAGGKVWGAIEKATGHEFIYRNEVMKFRNIALRGPWTSGGIEFNFGVIGHTPSTATPVDYKLVTNKDGSVSCFVGAMDLPSRTSWRVEIRLEPGASNFETNVFWNNPTSLVQPYYNWMTSAAFARNDLTMSIPGNKFLTHPGEEKAWPIDPEGRFLPAYANNTFEGHKSYHVVGEYNDYFGGYYADDNYGFAHWARFEDMPGQKLWLWALSREGSVWDGLLTDTDGQYVEYQAGRMLVQYSPGLHDNPISKTGFPPLATDTWKERWFPVMGTGGISDVSKDGVLFVERSGETVRVALNTFTSFSGPVEIRENGSLKTLATANVEPLELWETTFKAGSASVVEVKVPGLDLIYSEDSGRLTLEREFELEPEARHLQSEAEQNVFKGRQLANAAYYPAARLIFDDVLTKEPWNRDALVEMASLDLRQGLLMEGLARARKVLRLDAHDADANFIAGSLYQAAGSWNDARDAYSWAARSMTYRSAANARISEIALIEKRYDEAIEFAHRALDYDKNNLSALEVVAISKRSQGTDNSMTVGHLKTVDPLNHFARAEILLNGGAAEDFRAGLRSEFPDQTVLELAIRYAVLGRKVDAIRILESVVATGKNPMIHVWLAFLTQNEALLDYALDLDVAFANPYRVESVNVLNWARAISPSWKWSYLEGLNLWALNRGPAALSLWNQLKNEPDMAAFYVARAFLSQEINGSNPEPDLLRAAASKDANRLTDIYLIRQLQLAGKWTEAETRSSASIIRHPHDFNLKLLHAKSLLFLGRPSEAVAILDILNVLPSESGRDSHTLFEAAHLLNSINNFELGKLTDAEHHARQALEWPEHLGQGRPYEPDERAAAYILFRIAEANAQSETARIKADEFFKMDAHFGENSSPFSALGNDILKRLGRTQEADSRATSPEKSTPMATKSLIDLLVEKSINMTTHK